MAHNTPFDPFEALGLPRDASSAAIRTRYLELSRRYHPSRHQGPDETKAGLAGHFHVVHQAYNHLSTEDKRRRYVELLRLADEQEALLARMADLLAEDERKKEQKSRQSTLIRDGHVSSDADEDDLPQIATLRRRTTLDRPTATAAQLGGISASSDELSRAVSALEHGLKSRRPAFQPPVLSAEETDGKEGDYFSKRRKRLEKLRRNETAAFFQYRDAMVEKFEADLQSEHKKELYERAIWKREYFERAPRETTERMRSFQHFVGAVRAFGQQSSSRNRNRPTISYTGQILSTGDFYESGQYLTAGNALSPSKAKSLHRRGWSSDISGDQTSSDDNSSGYASPMPDSSWTWHRKHSRNSSLEALLTPSGLHHERSANASLPDHQPFKMVVRHPTGFHDQLDGRQDSSQDTASRSSGSPSPNQFPSAFTIVGTSGLSSALGFGQPVNDSASQSRNTASSRIGTDLLLVEDSRCFRIKPIDGIEWRHVPTENVHELNFSEKSRVLRANVDVEAEPEALLQRLAQLDRNVCGNFMVKPDTKEAFRFRLIYNQPEPPRKQHHSFIALSYRRKYHVQNEHGHFTLPLPLDLFQAVWEERCGDEGVWIDQISIDQDSRTETTISMSAMDMVYRSARLIVVVLDDVEFDMHEGKILQDHMEEYYLMVHVATNKRFRGKQPPYLETHDELYNVLLKLLRSAWFRRAWCRHEMRLARDHVFLVPCRSSGTRDGRSVIRFTSQCLTHLLALATETPFDDHIELVKPALNAFFRDRSKVVDSAVSLHSHHGNFTTVIAEVFGMEAGGDPRIPARQRASDARKDKLSIVLNTMECGLALTAAMREPGVLLSTSECHYMLLMLALAARDPGALCSVGPPMRLLQPDALSPSATSTWLFEPTNVDSGLNNWRTLSRLPARSSVTTGLHLGEHFVQLDLKFLQPGKVSHGLEDGDNITLARHFISVCDQRRFGRNRHRYLTSDPAANRHFGNMQDVYIRTLSCVFECGPDWVREVCHRYAVSRWKHDLQSAYELLVALKSTGGKWPAGAWSAQAAGFIMDFVNFLIIRGLPQRQILHREEWRPIWISTQMGGKVMTFVPPGNIQPAVPTALLDPNYVRLARLWVVVPRPRGYGCGVNGVSGPQEWTLLGKSVLFSDDVALEQLHSSSGVLRERQQVFGREDPEVQRLVRERGLHF